MKTFLKKNDELESTMKTHLIDVDKDGIFDNDYEKFYNNRLKRISAALSKFIIQQEVEGDLEEYEDIEEPIEIEN